MKKIILLTIVFALSSCFLFAQKPVQQYPTPEFSNEIYFFKKDVAQVFRLEKGYSKVEAKTKMGGFVVVKMLILLKAVNHLLG
jgi:hypothetical protein